MYAAHTHWIYLQRWECVWWESTGSFWDKGIIKLLFLLRSCRLWKEKEDSWYWTLKNRTKTPTTHSELENLHTSLLMGDAWKENPEKSDSRSGGNCCCTKHAWRGHQREAAENQMGLGRPRAEWCSAKHPTKYVEHTWLYGWIWMPLVETSAWS